MTPLEEELAVASIGQRAFVLDLRRRAKEANLSLRDAELIAVLSLIKSNEPFTFQSFLKFGKVAQSRLSEVIWIEQNTKLPPLERELIKRRFRRRYLIDRIASMRERGRRLRSEINILEKELSHLRHEWSPPNIGAVLAELIREKELK